MTLGLSEKKWTWSGVAIGNVNVTLICSDRHSWGASAKLCGHCSLSAPAIHWNTCCITIETNRRSIEDARGLRVQHSPCVVSLWVGLSGLTDRPLCLLSSWSYWGQPTDQPAVPWWAWRAHCAHVRGHYPTVSSEKLFPRPDSVSLKKLSLTPIDLSSHPAPISPAFCFLIVASGYYVQSIDRSRRPWSMES